MKVNKILFFLLSALCLFLCPVPAAEEQEGGADSVVNRYSLDRLDWLVGKWRGEAFGGVMEEVWEAPSGGSMMGCFKLVTDNKIGFYEFMTVTVDSAGPVLKLKHFNADLTGWEEKDKVVTFPFVSLSENKIQFDGLSYERYAGDSLRIIVRLKDAKGAPSDVVLKCARAEE
jgi:hypothetical protein